LGLFEVEEYSNGTNYVAQAVALRAKGRPYGVIGGGETIVAVDRLGLAPWVDFVSTGGGAMLEALEGKTLPAIKPLLR
jgi:phosphoglycerate kinase